MQEHWDRKRITRLALLPADPKLKETVMPRPCLTIINQAAIAPLDDPAPQAHQPQIGNRQRQKQSRDAIAISDATAIEVKAPTLPVTEHRLDPHPATAALISLPTRAQIGHHAAHHPLAVG